MGKPRVADGARLRLERVVARLPSDVVDCLDRLADELRKAHPDERYSRASLMRRFIDSALHRAETEEKAWVDVADRGRASRRGGAG